MADTAGMPAVLKLAAFLQTHPGQQMLENLCSSEANLTCALCDCQGGFAVHDAMGLKHCMAGILLGPASRAHNFTLSFCYHASVVECVTN